MSRKIDIAWMIRTGRAIPGSLIWGGLSWTCGGEPSGSIGYEADMREVDNAELRLSYTRGSGDDREHVKQTMRLTYTRPNYGGRRWWMICPYRHNRCGKLYLPAWGDRFAGRQAWRLGYLTQRGTRRDRLTHKLHKLERKLADDGDMWRRPKGMWNRTYERILARCEELDAEIDAELAWAVAKILTLAPR